MVVFYAVWIHILEYFPNIILRRKDFLILNNKYRLDII